MSKKITVERTARVSWKVGERTLTGRVIPGEYTVTSDGHPLDTYEMKIREDVAEQLSPSRLTEKIAALLDGAGYSSADAISNAPDEDLLGIEGLGEATLREIRSVYPKNEEE